jgi:hypothetical protein
MRLIDADAFKKYIQDSYSQNKDAFKTEKWKKVFESVTKGILMDIDEQPTVFGTFQEIIKTAEEICKKNNDCNECPFDDDECMIRGMAGCADDIVEICKKYMEEKQNE